VRVGSLGFVCFGFGCDKSEGGSAFAESEFGDWCLGQNVVHVFVCFGGGFQLRGYYCLLL